MATVLHPNGFLQHDLPDGRRIHVWHPDLPVAQKIHTPLHDHTFEFESRVLYGILVHEEWDVVEVGEGPLATHKVYAVQGPLLVDTDARVIARPRADAHLTRGSVYHFGGPGRFHDTRGLGPTATLMAKTKTEMAPYPHVLVPRRMRPDNAFRRDQYPEADLLPFVQEALGILRQEASA